MYRITLLLAVFALTSPALAQPLLSLYSARSPNQQASGYFGRFVESIGDANNDGIPDMLVAAYNELSNTGRVYYLSGADGSEIRTFNSPLAMANGFFGLSIAAAGDANSDGTPDFIVGAYHPVNNIAGAGVAYVISGADGSVLLQLQSPTPQLNGYFSFRVAAPGDLNGDGTGDFVVMAGDEDVEVGGNVLEDHGAGYAFSGTDGSLLWQTTPQTQEQFIFYARVVSAGGDLNDDGVPDLITSAVGATDTDGVRSGLAYAVSGSDGSIIYQMQSGNNIGNSDGFFGYSLASLGDLTGDGVPEIAVGTPFEGVAGTSVRDGTVSFFNGATGTRIGTYALDTRQAERRFGWEVGSVGDYDGDGVNDVAVTSLFEFNSYEFRPPPFSTPNSGAVFIYSGAKIGNAVVDEIVDLYPTLPDFPVDFSWQFGEDFSAIGDIDGDGLSDLAVSVPGQGTEIGFVALFPASRLLSISAAAVDAQDTKPVEANGTYVFDSTGVSIAFEGLGQNLSIQPTAGRLVAVDGLPDGSSVTSSKSASTGGDLVNVRVERHLSAATDLAGITQSNVAGYRWVAVADADFSFGATTEIRFDVSDIPNAGITEAAQVVVYRRESFGSGTFEPLTTTYDSAAGELVASGFTKLGEFTFASDSNPLPTEGAPELPRELTVSALYPNPVATSATVELTVATPALVMVAVYDALGRRVSTLHNGPLPTGETVLEWDASRLPAGVYAVRASAVAATVTQMFTVMR